MIDTYLEAEYNNRAKVPGHPAVIAAWVRDAAAFRAGAVHAEFDVGYGPSPRQVMDVFWPGSGRGGRIAMFIHGGYWQGLDKSFMSHMARGLLAHGIAVALPSYDLCPQVRLADIVDQVAAAARVLIARHGRLDVATGHSAGGHLAAMLLAEGLVSAAVPISGLFDLRPLVATSINGLLGLDEAEAWRLSPLARRRPAGLLHALVGGEEGIAYETQSRRIAEAWEGQWESVKGHDHFTIPDELARPDGRITAAICGVLGQRGAGPY